MKKLIVIIFMLCVMATARLPAPGDDVAVLASNGPLSHVVAYKGIVEDFTDGYICINCTEEMDTNTGDFAWPNTLMCINRDTIKRIEIYNHTNSSS